MLKRIIEITNEGTRLSLYRGFIQITTEQNGTQRVPLADLGVVVVSSHGVTYSNTLMVKLAQLGVMVVLCGSNHLPEALFWPLKGHYAQSAKMGYQLTAPPPLKKRLWQTLIKAKITQQAEALATLGKKGAEGLHQIARKVKSGDPTNIEAHASRRYWLAMFGNGFRRDRTQAGINSLLNYGYTILRSATARAVVAAGLHPSVGIHHKNPTNHMNLVDDLMEPFRPMVDVEVADLASENLLEIDPATKTRLAQIPFRDMITKHGNSPIAICLTKLASSLAVAYESGKAELDLPAKPFALKA